MTVTIMQLANRGQMPFELHWIAGLAHNEKGLWFARAVFRRVGDSPMRFEMHPLPIGMMPILAPGRVFVGGEMSLQPRGGAPTMVTIPDMSVYEEITSADIPHGLYSFGDKRCGIQRLFRYMTDQGEVLIPTIELVRYLFLHSRTLANALMRPGAINLLFRPELPGHRKNLDLLFTSEMPKRCLTREFVREFAWLALEPDARRSWDSVWLQSHDLPYLTFSPPALTNSTWAFRGIRQGNQHLVLELLRVSGKQLPCKTLSYGHPSLKRARRVPGDDHGSGTGGGGDWDDQSRTRVIYDVEVDDEQLGAKSDSNPKVISLPLKRSEFEHDVTVSKILIDVPPASPQKSNRGCIEGPGKPGRKRRVTIRSSAGELALTAGLPPIEFKLLTPAEWDRQGDLAALSNTVRHMAARLPSVQFSMSLCCLKAGRSFSTINRIPRLALVVLIIPKAAQPIVLLDVQRAGGVMLSLMALKFAQNQTAEIVEIAIKKMLDGLVDANGHWAREIEVSLSAACECERFPKALSPRDNVESLGYVLRWATILMQKLGLEIISSD